MTERTSVARRIAAGVLGSGRPGRRAPTVEEQRRLPLKRRILASVLGIRVRPSVPRVSARDAAEVRATSAMTPPLERRATAPRRNDFSEYAPEPLPRPSSTRRPTPTRTAPADWGSVPQHLLSEDRQEYERILDEALRSAPHRPELAAVGQRLNPEQLRTMALNATPLITAAAATEYQHYVKVREELRHPAPSTPSSSR
ncbi:hypothetical protein ACWCY3_16850, partial [Streptomyces sp. NPDC001658]